MEKVHRLQLQSKRNTETVNDMLTLVLIIAIKKNDIF